MIWHMLWLLATLLASVLPVAWICKVYTNVPPIIIFSGCIAIGYFLWYKKYAKEYLVNTLTEDITPKELLEALLIIVVAGGNDLELVAVLNAVTMNLYKKPLDVYIKETYAKMAAKGMK